MVFLCVNFNVGKGGIALKTETLISDPVISVKDACQKLGGISKWTIYAWLSQGKLARTKVGSRTMIRMSELERLVASR